MDVKEQLNLECPEYMFVYLTIHNPFTLFHPSKEGNPTARLNVRMISFYRVLLKMVNGESCITKKSDKVIILL